MSMTDNAANIAMCNQALGLLGAAVITLTATTEQNYVYCALFFDGSRDEILAFHKWNKAKKRAFALQTTDPVFGPDNAFTYPTDCLKVWMIEENPLAKFEVEGDLILTNFGDKPPSWVTATDYVAGQYISSDDSGSDLTYLVDTGFTSSTETTDLSTYCTSQSSDLQVLAVEYVYQKTDVSTWPEYMRQCAIYNLAIKLAPAIKQNEKAALNLQAMLYGSKDVIGYMDIARSTDAQEQGGVVIVTNKLIRSRRTGRIT